MTPDSTTILKLAVFPTLVCLYGMIVLFIYIPTKNIKISAITALPVIAVIAILLAPFIPY